LKSYLSQFEAIGEFPQIQEYCAGYGLGQFVFLHRGEAILKFQHRRIHEYPPEGGFSTLCESLSDGEHVELMKKSVAMLQSMDWEGAAMVEYRFDPKTNKARLMEINGRFWGSLPLAYYSGAEFAWLTYAVLGEGMEEARCATRSGVRCRAIVTETKRLWQILFLRRTIQDRSLRFSRLREVTSYILEFFNPRTRHFVFAWTDYRPFFADMFFSIVNRLGGR
jgi:predicted ATP-grasp superfamily ATP-dependent carboligase